ncbi:glycine betaine/proline transport system substrate-binding protein [Murinocardiopsis flavida]|uniref:Glycine betaine/proline transport system substrate-binding protein n=1 Tax=Murinocardiopsis flavida TaxID=645275 RepID=A0A2P8DGA6_9ACTN|nr:glycine betaine/proline transport system substrate-binding protein [Murinocardiopsis flavida]
MVKRSRRLLGIGAAAASLVLFAGACAGEGGGVDTGPEEGEGAGKTISIGLIPWEEDITVTNLWKVILEEKGYTVDIKNVDVGPMYEGTAQGDIDLFLDTWLPTTHKSYWDQYGDQLEDLGAWNENASLQITVPEYVEDVNSIEDLKGKGDEFDGKIIGIESGSGLVKTTKESMLPDYGLKDEYELVESSTPAMLTELESAIKDEKPIVVTLWRPHPSYAKFDLKDLEDPKESMGGAEKIHMVGREGFSEDFGELNGWLKKFKVDDDTLADMEKVVLEDHKDKEEEGARAWLKDNPEFVQEVLGKDAEGLKF